MSLLRQEEKGCSSFPRNGDRFYARSSETEIINCEVGFSAWTRPYFDEDCRAMIASVLSGKCAGKPSGGKLFNARRNSWKLLAKFICGGRETHARCGDGGALAAAAAFWVHDRWKFEKFAQFLPSGSGFGCYEDATDELPNSSPVGWVLAFEQRDKRVAANWPCQGLCL